MKALIIFLSFIVLSCVSQPSIPPTMSGQKIIQMAQEETNRRRWDTAIYYYEVLKERFPNDPELQLTADYELSFLQYKKKNYAEAQRRFTSLLNKYYEGSEASLYPLWPKVLSEKLLITIEEKL